MNTTQQTNEERIIALTTMGGRMTKFKGMVASIAPSCAVVALAVGMASGVEAQDLGPGVNTVTGSQSIAAGDKSEYDSNTVSVFHIIPPHYSGSLTMPSTAAESGARFAL